MSAEGTQRRLVAILSADVAGYSRLMAEDEQGTIQTLTAYREAIGTLVEQHHGRVVDSPGDNLLAEFPSALDAVQSAAEIQGVLRVRNQSLPESRRMLFRIGVHLGDITAEGRHVYGDGVNIAARLERLAEPGEVCISGAVHQQVRGTLDIGYVDLGEQQIKNIPEAVRAYRISADPAATTPARGTRRGILSAAAGVLALAALALWGLYPRSSSTPEPAEPVLELPSQPSIAVLPFTNMSGDPEQEYFSDGITEDLITDLSKISGLFVIARNSVFTYKGRPVKVQEVARDLGVAYVLEGSVRKAEERVRITAQLVDALTGKHLWADRYDRDLRDVFALQSEVARSIAREIRVTLTPEEEERLSSPNIVEPGAYDAYLKGRYFWNKRGEWTRRAIEYFERAIELDPSYASAYAGLADSLSLLPAYDPEPAREVMPRAEAAARKALEIDSTLGEAHTSLGWVRAFYHWDWAGAERSFQTAIELDPGYPTAHSWYGVSLWAVGRIDEGAAELERAHELDPLSLVMKRNLGYVYMLQGDHERAIKALLDTLELDPELALTRRWLAEAYVRAGEYDKAVAIIPPGDQEAPWIYAMAGKREEALRRLDALGERSQREHVPSTPRARAYAALGEDERAMEWLERAYEERDIWLGLFLKNDPLFERLHLDPRFRDLLRRMNYAEAS
ncbi:MAG: tetratricopeptide repeat protein [Myxococcota bacterium]